MSSSINPNEAKAEIGTSSPTNTSPAASLGRLFNIMLAVEILLAGILYLTYDANSNPGAIIWILPMMAAYLFVAGGIYAIPALAIQILRRYKAYGMFQLALALVAGVANTAAAIWLTIAIVSLFIRSN